MLNKFPLWKNIMLVVILVVAVLYALPNLYGEDPAVQVSGKTSKAVIDTSLTQKIVKALKNANIQDKSVATKKDILLIRFFDTDDQIKALPIVRAVAGNQYTAAINLAPATPNWLQLLHATPMKKGLDLQGGIHFLLDVDVPSAISKRVNGMVSGMSTDLRKARVHYESVTKHKDVVVIRFKDEKTRDTGYDVIRQDYPNLSFTREEKNGQFQLVATLTTPFIQKIRQYTIDQTLTTLRNRINELGISEPLVQTQGATRISVDLPGVQDSAQARQILGGTATLEFHLVDPTHDASAYLSGALPPPGTRIYQMADTKQPILLNSQVVLSGNSITSASSSFGQDGRPVVNISLGGGGESFFSRMTAKNIGNRMAIVYVDSKTEMKMINGKPVRVRTKTERVISAPVIQSALGNQFQITGLTDGKEATNLALLLRAGAMPVNVAIVEEQTVGASLGQENIRLGLLAVEVAFLLIVLFMAFYYRVFGLVADFALFLNLLLIMSVLSILGATLTLPGIAGIVLTVGMAIDANVLIFERIREELRLGMTPQASIHAGFERAFSTIVDANVTTLIVAAVLFGIGSGPVKGFAVTLIIGLMASMFTAITFTRGIVNLIYGGKPGKRLALGIKY